VCLAVRVLRGFLGLQEPAEIAGHQEPRGQPVHLGRAVLPGIRVRLAHQAFLERVERVVVRVHPAQAGGREHQEHPEKQVHLEQAGQVVTELQEQAEHLVAEVEEAELHGRLLRELRERELITVVISGVPVGQTERSRYHLIPQREILCLLSTEPESSVHSTSLLTEELLI
jgi:hypothetical protein